MTSMRLILLFMQLKKLVVKLTHPCLITSLQTLPEIGLRRIKSFQRGTVGLCRSIGVKVTSCQSWKFEKNSASRPESNHSPAAQVQVLNNWIILKV